VNYSDELLEEKSNRILSWLNRDEEEEILIANYQILVQQVEANVEIRVVSLDGNSLDKEQTLKLLNIFRSNMS
jgi:uncharacterized lipoprotein